MFSSINMNCDYTCLSCNGPLSTNCIACTYDKELLANGTCGDCAINQYYNFEKLSCIGCPTGQI